MGHGTRARDAARYAGDHRRGGARPDTRLGAFDAGLLRGPTRGGAAGPRSPETTWSSMAHGGSSAPDGGEANDDRDDATVDEGEGKRDGAVRRLTTQTMAVTARSGKACLRRI